MLSIQIRKARPEELDSVTALVKSMWIQHGVREPRILNEEYLRLIDTKLYFKPCFEQPDKNVLYVAFYGKDLVGCCRAEIIELEGMFNERRAIYVDDLVVKEGYQRKGIGKQLLKEVESFAKSQNINLLKARIYEFNTNAQWLFKNQKFRTIYAEYYKELK